MNWLLLDREALLSRNLERLESAAGSRGRRAGARHDVLQLSMRVSSAASELWRLRAGDRRGIYSTNQASLSHLSDATRRVTAWSRYSATSWTGQVQILQSVIAAGDRASCRRGACVRWSARSSSLMQQISSVATCGIRARASQTLPIDRLDVGRIPARRGDTRSTCEASPYCPTGIRRTTCRANRCRCWLIWLFQQIDTSNSAAVAYMSDGAVRVAILLGQRCSY